MIVQLGLYYISVCMHTDSYLCKIHCCYLWLLSLLWPYIIQHTMMIWPWTLA